MRMHVYSTPIRHGPTQWLPRFSIRRSDNSNTGSSDDHLHPDNSSLHIERTVNDLPIRAILWTELCDEIDEGLHAGGWFPSTCDTLWICTGIWTCLGLGLIVSFGLFRSISIPFVYAGVSVATAVTLLQIYLAGQLEAQMEHRVRSICEDWTNRHGHEAAATLERNSSQYCSVCARQEFVVKIATADIWYGRPS